MQTHLLRLLQRGVGVGVAGLHVLVHVGAFRPPVGHADLLPLIDEGRPLLEQVHGGKTFGALRPEFLASVAGNDSGMVVVFDVKGVPAPAAELFLPGGKGFFHPPQAELHGQVIGEQAVGGDALELDHHVQLAVLLVNVRQRPFRRHHGGFRQREAVVVIQHVVLEFAQVFVDAGAVIVVWHPLAGRHQVIVRQAFLLGDVGDHVLPEAVHPHVQPEAQNPLHFLPHLGVVHIQVGLLHGEQVQIVFPPNLVKRPGFPLKEGIPVVGELPAGLSGTPDVVVGVRVDALAAFLEPFMLVAGVVHHEIHDDLHVPGVSALQHLFKRLHAAEFRRDVPVIGNIVAAVRPGGGVDGGKPDAVAAQTFDVVQLFIHTPQVAHAVTVAVLEGSRPDLVKHLVLVPPFALHAVHSFLGFVFIIA